MCFQDLAISKGLRFNLVMTLATMGVSIIWALAIGFALPKLEFYTLQALITVIFGGGALFYIVARPDPQVARLMLNIVLGFWFLAFAILFSYLCATFNLPLVDSELAAIDQALGIDWPGMVTWASTQGWITHWARFIYDRPFSELLAVIAILAVLGRPDRVEEFVSCFMISGIITAFVGGLLPADSGYAYYQVPSEVFSSFKAVVTPAYLEHFHALRAGEMHSLVVGDVRGLVAFPSYHTAFSLLLIYAVRGYKLLFYPSLALNLLVVATTPFVGAHYVIDVIGGFGVVGLAVWAVSQINRESRAPIGGAVTQPANA
jgi:hypothetical protein